MAIDTDIAMDGEGHDSHAHEHSHENSHDNSHESSHDHRGPGLLSSFERLPGEVRNEIYAYLLHPARNTTYDRSPQTANSYGFRGQTPTDIDDEDEEDELKVYQATAPRMSRVRLHHEILLTNRRIYREAHSYLYTACAPVLVVSGVPYNTLVCTLMSRLGFRPFYTQQGTLNPDDDDTVHGCAGLLHLRWMSNSRLDDDDDDDGDDGENGDNGGDDEGTNDELAREMARDYPMYRLTPRQPDIVLIQPQIADFVRFLQILKIRDVEKSEIFHLNFIPSAPTNIFSEPIGDDAYTRCLHQTVFDGFAVFRGTGIVYHINSGYCEMDYQSDFLALANQPIMWLRCEILRLAELFDSIAKQGYNCLGEQDPIDDFCRWVFIGDLIRNKIEKSYPHLSEFHPLVEELQPVDLLHQILQISFYNFSRCLFMMVIDIESPGEEVLEVPVLSRDQISMVYHLQGTICLHCHSKDAELIEEAQEFFRSSVEYADGDRKEALEKLTSSVQTLVLDEDGNVPPEFMEMVVSTLPQGPMNINIPTQMKSFRVDYERRILREYSYKGSLLEDRFFQDPPEDERSMVTPPPIEFDMEVYCSAGSVKGRKAWLGSGTQELFVTDRLDDL
ncbi:hypothetical protein DRE_00239 [Drechslerella stenobrocha 248]|uniref:Uncharacterized protein n=1 Tax=Drechslerella stenobrocha 248 TaxID=1043628 RepID=W7HZJ3_9PEZI|nr:hypothetical protein DRE_00239 [Drechslerella stenobrocha 248]